jgi:AcrR family transcriptional regulator
MKTAVAPRQRANTNSQEVARGQILEAAFSVFAKKGYAAASMLEIATLARVSKRELYAIVGTKQTLLVACITRRSARLRMPDNLPAPDDHEKLERVLQTFGSKLVAELSDPTVIAVFRLAIAEAIHAPEVAHALDAIGREASRSALRKVMTQAQSARLIDGRPHERAEQFSGLLWGNLMVGLLLGVTDRPSQRAIMQRTRDATEAFLHLCRSPA